MAHRKREEVLNVTLATCVAARGMRASPETILPSPDASHAMPDVIASFRGLRWAVEGKVGDIPNARDLVTRDAKSRVDNGIAHMAIGVIYPADLRETPFASLHKAMEKSIFEFFVYTEAGASDWRTGGVDSMLSELRRAHEALSRDDVVQKAVDQLSVGMDAVANVLFASAATCDRLVDLLGIGETGADGKNTD